MNGDLFLSILALDSYNRGYNAGTNVTGEQVGTAQITSQGFSDDWQNIGFYATAYSFGGETIISYRGTDNFGAHGDFTANGSGASDIFTGWSIAFGFSTGTQAGAALQFYNDVVTQATYQGGPQTLVTGHSLGGGLAGFVASQTHSAGVGFDHEPFGLATWLQYGANYTATLGNPTLPEPDASGFRSIYVDGEALEYVRAGAVQGPLAVLLSRVPALAAFVAGGGVFTALNESGFPRHEINNHGSNRNAVDLHSQNLLVLLKYAETAHTGWYPINDEFYSAVFDPEIGKAIGLVSKQAGGTGTATEDGQLRTAIAYSAIDEGERPFGDTGIRAMFNDLDQLGKYYEEHPTGFLAGDGIKQALVDIAVQYAGDLALQDKQDDVEAHKGTLAVFNDENVMVVDFDPAEWVKTTKNGNEIVGRTELIEALIAESGGDYELKASDAEDITVFYATLTDDSVKWSVGNDIPAAASGDPAGAILVGGAGDDQFLGGKGDDVLVGGHQSPPCCGLASRMKSTSGSRPTSI
jgi:hypothetical protein